jgi:hypothetical protein
VPGVLGVGAVIEKFPEPNSFETFSQVKVGVACETVKEALLEVDEL